MTKKCLNCGKGISGDREFCNRDCWREYREKQGIVRNTVLGDIKQNNPNFNFWMSGDGMIRREHNIDVVKNLIKSGLSYEEIVRRARKKFRSRTIDEYYGIALDEIRNGIEGDEESFMDYVKRRKKEKEGTK